MALHTHRQQQHCGGMYLYSQVRQTTVSHIKPCRPPPSAGASKAKKKKNAMARCVLRTDVRQTGRLIIKTTKVLWRTTIRPSAQKQTPAALKVSCAAPDRGRVTLRRVFANARLHPCLEKGTAPGRNSSYVQQDFPRKRGRPLQRATRCYESNHPTNKHEATHEH